MTQNELLMLADKGHPDGVVNQYAPDPDGYHGDPLSEFIARMLIDVHKENADSKTWDQCFEACDAIAKAMLTLQGVYNVLHAQAGTTALTGELDITDLRMAPCDFRGTTQ